MNMNKVFIFLLGAAAGSLVTWKIVKEKYEQIADEEIESVIDYYRNKEENEDEDKNITGLTDEEIDKVVDETKTALEDYNSKIKDLGYADEEIEDDECIVITEQAVDFIAPYVISPEEFGEGYDFETKSWTYYADCVLTDEVGNIIFEPESIIGDALEHFGDYGEEDSVYVRNENTECDYEILKHEKTFSEINEEDS